MIEDQYRVVRDRTLGFQPHLLDLLLTDRFHGFLEDMEIFLKARYQRGWEARESHEKNLDFSRPFLYPELGGVQTKS